MRLFDHSDFEMGRPRTQERMIDGVLHKQCNDCKEFLPIEEAFYVSHRGARLHPCKACRGQRVMEWRRDNPDKVEAYNEVRRQRYAQRKARKASN